MEESTDILENDILAMSSDVLRALLKDHSVSHHFGENRNIFWATADYKSLGDGYDYYDPITIECITGMHGQLILPRAKKSREVQQQRIQEKAEVFTPAWICNKQNNLIDDAWFGYEGVFNTELDEDEQHFWCPKAEKILFPENKNWQDYVCALRLEVACGEAPYITSRYDATLCDSLFPVRQRIGFLDRKLRIVGENTSSPEEWLVWGFNALHSVYGFEWQGDNLLLARENILFTFKEHYEEKFHLLMDMKTLENAAYIISWNLWQMDGVKCVVPMSCDWAVKADPINEYDSEGNSHIVMRKRECKACKKNETVNHLGIRCEVIEWKKVTEKEPHRTGSKLNMFYFPNINNVNKR